MERRRNLSHRPLANARYDTDKSGAYLQRYDKYFSPLANKEIKLLELGVLRGGSLLLWRDYFLKGTIAGLDINLTQLEDPTGRIHMYQGLQQDRKLLDSIAHDVAPAGFDIIIDDASHVGELTRISFWHLFDHHLKPGGIFAIEDWRTGYYRDFVDGKRYLPPQETNRVNAALQNFLDTLTSWTEEKIVGRQHLRDFLKRALQRLRKMTVRRKLRSHSYGMVGFVKQLVDELGMDMITGPAGGGRQQRDSKFLSMEIFPGQVFIVKNPDLKDPTGAPG